MYLLKIPFPRAVIPPHARWILCWLIIILLAGGCYSPEETYTPLTFPKIAFVSSRDGNGDIYIMNSDGSGQTNLSRGPGEDLNPAFSRDGSRIAFQSKRDGNWEIYLIDTDGTRLVNLTSDPFDDIEPQFQPQS